MRSDNDASFRFGPTGSWRSPNTAGTRSGTRSRAHSLSVLTLDRERIADFTTFLDPEPLPRFGLLHQIEPRNA